MKTTLAGLVFCFVVIITGCASTPPAEDLAKAPANTYESIHTLVRQIHLDYGNHEKARYWNKIVSVPLGRISYESIKIGQPVKSEAQLDALVSANSRNTTDRYSNKSKARQKEGLYREATAAKNAMKTSVLAPAYRVSEELDDIEVVIGDYCREHKQGQVHRIYLNGQKDDPVMSKPIPMNPITENSQIRLVCITGDSKPYQSPFMVDFNFASKTNRRLQVFLIATVLTPETQRRMLQPLEDAGALP